MRQTAFKSCHHKTVCIKLESVAKWLISLPIPGSALPEAAWGIYEISKFLSKILLIYGTWYSGTSAVHLHIELRSPPQYDNRYFYNKRSRFRAASQMVLAGRSCHPHRGAQRRSDLPQQEGCRRQRRAPEHPSHPWCCSVPTCPFRQLLNPSLKAGKERRGPGEGTERLAMAMAYPPSAEAPKVSSRPMLLCLMTSGHQQGCMHLNPI